MSWYFCWFQQHSNLSLDEGSWGSKESYDAVTKATTQCLMMPVSSFPTKTQKNNFFFLVDWMLILLSLRIESTNKKSSLNKKNFREREKKNLEWDENEKKWNRKYHKEKEKSGLKKKKDGLFICLCKIHTLPSVERTRIVRWCFCQVHLALYRRCFCVIKRLCLLVTLLWQYSKKFMVTVVVVAAMVSCHWQEKVEGVVNNDNIG